VGQQEDATNYPSKIWRVQLCSWFQNSDAGNLPRRKHTLCGYVHSSQWNEVKIMSRLQQMVSLTT
jgi:hypothetical protein